MALMVILIIAGICIIISENNTINALMRQNSKLKQMLKEREEELRKYVQANEDSEKVINIENSQAVKGATIDDDILKNTIQQNRTIEDDVSKHDVIQNDIEERKEDHQVKEDINTEELEKLEKESKNTLILGTGAVLIILAAIVFLVSSWYIIPNILKTVVLILVIGLFFGMSKIAKDKFNLEKTSNTFFYIAMAYIPICLFSISLFGLVGKSLSITGEARYVYFLISGVITAIVYYCAYQFKKNIVMFYGSIVTQIFAVMQFSLIFSNSVEWICMNLLLYNILLILLFGKQLKNICNVLPYIITVFMLCTLGNLSSINCINIILLAVNFLLLERKQTAIVKAGMFNCCVMFFGIYTFRVLDITKQFEIAMIVLYILMIHIIEQSIYKILNNNENLLCSSSTINLVVIRNTTCCKFFRKSLFGKTIYDIFVTMYFIINHI